MFNLNESPAHNMTEPVIIFTNLYHFVPKQENLRDHNGLKSVQGPTAKMLISQTQLGNKVAAFVFGQ